MPLIPSAALDSRPTDADIFIESSGASMIDTCDTALISINELKSGVRLKFILNARIKQRNHKAVYLPEWIFTVLPGDIGKDYKMIFCSSEQGALSAVDSADNNAVYLFKADEKSSRISRVIARVMPVCPESFPWYPKRCNDEYLNAWLKDFPQLKSEAGVMLRDNWTKQWHSLNGQLLAVAGCIYPLIIDGQVYPVIIESFESVNDSKLTILPGTPTNGIKVPLELLKECNKEAKAGVHCARNTEKLIDAFLCAFPNRFQLQTNATLPPIVKSFLIEGQTGVVKELRVICRNLDISIYSLSVFKLLCNRRASSETHRLLANALYSAPSIVVLKDLGALINSPEECVAEFRPLITLVKQFCLCKELALFAVLEEGTATDLPLMFGRLFEKTVRLELPTQQERMLYLQERKHCDRIVQLTSGYSGRDLEQLCNVLDALNDHNDVPIEAFSRLSIGTSSNGTDAETEQRLSAAFDCFMPSDPLLASYCSVKRFDSAACQVAGYSSVLGQILELLQWHSVYRETFERLNVSRPRGALLYGPSGCGKSLITRHLSSMFNCIFVNGAELYSKYFGETERVMRDIFQSARRLSPAVLVLDDLEFLGGAVRGSSGGESAVEERLLTTLLNEIDGIDTSAECEVFVLGACSCDLTQLDPALLRPGRLGVHVKVDRPSTQDRKQIFELYVRLYFNHALPLDGTLMDQMVERTAGWSGAEIEFAIRRACATGDAVTSETLLDAL